MRTTLACTWIISKKIKIQVYLFFFTLLIIQVCASGVRFWEDPGDGFFEFAVKRALNQDQIVHMEGKLQVICYFSRDWQATKPWCLNLKWMKVNNDWKISHTPIFCIFLSSYFFYVPEIPTTNHWAWNLILMQNSSSVNATHAKARAWIGLKMQNCSQISRLWWTSYN